MNIREDIKAYIDGELSAARAEEVRAAIDADPALRQEYEFMSGLSRQMQSSVAVPSVQGYEKAMASVSGGRKRKFRWIEGLAVAAAVAILGAVMFPMMSQSKLAAKRSVAMSESEEMARYSGLDADAGVDGLSVEQGVPMPFYGDREVGGDNGRVEDESFGVSAGVSGRARDTTIGPVSAGSTNPGGGLGGVEAFRRAASPPAAKSKAMERAMPTLAAQDVELAEDTVPRLVIKDATLSLEVEAVQEAIDETTLLVKGAKGYIESSSIAEGDEQANGFMVLRVPQKEFEDIVLMIKALGNLKSEHLDGDDVTGTVADVEARIKTLTAEEDSYRVLLRNATKVGDILDIKDRISRVRLQIESYDARRRTLSRLAALSTITVRFSTEEKEVVAEPVVEEPDEWFLDTKIASVTLLKGVGRFIAQIGTFLFILVPIWVPLLLGALWFRGRALRPADAS